MSKSQMPQEIIDKLRNLEEKKEERKTYLSRLGQNWKKDNIYKIYQQDIDYIHEEWRNK